MKSTDLECSECDGKLSTNQELKFHMNSKHSNAANLIKCDFCDSTFKKKQYLERHILAMHTDNPPVECQICSQKFK